MKRIGYVAMAATCVFLVSSMYLDSARGRAASPSPAPVVRLQQGWDDATAQAFYHMSQGSVIAPAAWLAALQSPSGASFMSAQNMRRLGFIADNESTPANRYGWPVGFATTDGAKTSGIPMAGLTCAACHTGELTYRGSTMRVDGGQAHVNLDAFKAAFIQAILSTGADAARRKSFESRAVAYGYPATQIDAQFDATYRGVAAQTGARAWYTAHGTTAGVGRVDALALIAQVVFNYGLKVPTNVNEATAPVDYPYLWDIWKLDWVQYNASVRQPMARNIGEALGVGAVTHFVDPNTGAAEPLPQRWRTSIPTKNLYAIETMLQTLKPPQWPQNVMGSVDPAVAQRGRELFDQNCASCHGVHAISGTNEWRVAVIPLRVIGTDPRQAENFASRTYDATKLGLSAHTRTAPGLQAVVGAVQRQAYVDDGIPSSSQAAFDGFGRKNVLVAPCGYKARPLVGVWATAPFLHNGSVPSIFALLSDRRPQHFLTGTTTYDPVNLGLAQSASAGGSPFDISKLGNSNAGHWFTNDRSRAGRIGRAFSTAEKYALIAYLKTATYSNYPQTTVSGESPMPCATSPAWADASH